MATVVPEYTAEELPLHQIFKSFPLGPSGDKQVQLFRRIYDEVPEFSEELADNNVVSLFLATGYPVAFFSTKPLENLNDIAGTKWRSASFWHYDFLKNAGAIPVTMPWGPEIYEALENGELDGLMVNVDSGYMLKVHEVAPNILVSKDLWLGHLYLVTVKKSVWEGLSDEDKAAIQEAAEQSYKSLGKVMDDSYATQLEELKAAGATVRELSAEEVQAWDSTTKYQQVQAAWVAKQQEAGVENAGPVVDKVAAIMKSVMEEA